MTTLILYLSSNTQQPTHYLAEWERFEFNSIPGRVLTWHFLIYLLERPSRPKGINILFYSSTKTFLLALQVFRSKTLSLSFYSWFIFKSPFNPLLFTVSLWIVVVGCVSGVEWWLCRKTRAVLLYYVNLNDFSSAMCRCMLYNVVWLWHRWT
jgi:hypothetical protein